MQIDIDMYFLFIHLSIYLLLFLNIYNQLTPIFAASDSRELGPTVRAMMAATEPEGTTGVCEKSSSAVESWSGFELKPSKKKKLPWKTHEIMWNPIGIL